MVAGGRVVLRRAARMDHHDDDDDEEYVVDGDDDEEEEHDAEDGEPEEEDEDESDAEEPEEEGGEDLEIDAPRRPPRGRGRKARSDDDDSDADFDGAEEEEESEEDLAAETTRPRRRLPPKPRPRRQAPKRRPKREREPEPEEDSDADFEEELGIGAPRPRARRRPTKPRKLRDESDEDFDGEDEIETPRPKRAPSRARRRARRKATPQEDESDEDFDAEDDELFEIETPRPRRAPRAARKPRLQEDESDADFDGEEDDDGLGNRGFEIDAPWPKRAPTARSRRRRVEQQIVESDADFEGDEEEPEHDEVEVETPQPASSGSNVKQEDEFDADFDGEEQFDDREEDEELEVKTPQPAKFDADFKGADDEVDDQEADEELEIETPQSVKYDADFNEADEEVEDLEADQELEIETPQSVKYDADFNGTDEEVDDQEEDEELEIETLELRNPSKARGKGRKVKPAGSSRQRHEDDDDYEEEIEDEDEDFDPGVDEDEEDIEEDVEEDDDDLGEYAITHATKVRPRNHLPKRKPAAERQHRKRKSGSKGKTRNGMAARRRRRSEWVADDDEEEEDDEDFVVDDDVDEEVNRPRKKAKDGRKTRDGSAEPVAVGEAWPSLESDTSEFEFVTSEEEHAENEAPVAEPARIKRKKGRRKKGSESDSSSDSDYVISEEELKDLGVLRSQGTLLQLPPPPALRTIVPRRVDEKGKEPEEALKQICGICLSEEQRATIQGILNCCSHYFCFACILEWSKVESKCPLCKRRFNTITKSSVADLGLGLRNAPVRVEKRDQVYQPTEDEMRRWLDPYENVVCIECNQGGDDNLMLLCDICDSSAHTFCVGLGREVPEGNWYCGGCRSSAEGPSYAQTHERVVHHGESNVNTADSSSSSFGRSISSGVFQRPPPINIQPPLQGFDLNLSPIETPEEDKRAESHISAEPVSTPTGRHATLDRRRALNRRIRILLFRPRTATNAWQNSVQRDRSTQGTEQNQWNTSTSTDLSPSGSRADFMQSQQSSSQFVESASNLARCADEGGSNFREVENAKDQLIPIVKKSIKHICARSPLDQSSFTEVARRATHTILALSGIAHNRDRVVATPFPFPSHCCHACDGREPAFLMRTICSSCFNLFVGDVVSHIANMLS